MKTNLPYYLLFTGLLSLLLVQQGQAEKNNAPTFGVIPDNLLLVTLTGFRARVSNDKVYLTWATQQEKNNRYFIVQRSTDGNHYDSIGVIAGTNTAVEHSYVFTDNKPLNGISYYRLKQVDLDHAFKYSPVINAITGSGNASRQVYPVYRPAVSTNLFRSSLNSFSFINCSNGMCMRYFQ